MGNLVAKLPASATSKIKKTYRGLFDSGTVSLTDGPVTKHFDSSEDFKNLDLDMDLEDSNLFDTPEIPEILITGLPLIRVTRKKRVARIFKIDLEKAIVSWKTHKFMSLDKIVQIRVGDDARNYREEYGVSQEQSDHWSTIIYNDEGSSKLKVLHIIAPSLQDFELFITTLSQLVTRRRNLMKYLSIPGENFADIHWKNYTSKDTDTITSFLTFDDILKLTKRLHINCNEKTIEHLFQKNDKGNKKALDFEEFQKFVKELKQRPEISKIFNQFSKNSPRMTRSQFHKFIRTEQLKSGSTQTIDKWFQKFTKGLDHLTIDSFTNYLTSSLLSPTDATKDDLSRPLNEYYISSSHNTYLIGKQFGNGSSSIEGYIKALQRGCRSIEIDIWDGDTGPVVRHGKLTGSISISDVFEVIRKHAFLITPYPLILSLEVHCKQEYQYKIRDLLLEIFNDVLVTEPLYPNQMKLPSPEDLKHRVLVKVKRTPHDNGSVTSLSTSSFASTTSACEENSGGEDNHKTRNFIKPNKKQFRIVSELSDLGVYAQGLRFTNFSLPESKTINHIFAFSERNFNSMIKDSEKDYLVLKHNRNYLMRVYPSGYRYNSTNFTPLKYWNYGAQMVATNWQTYDLGQQINEAMFNFGNRNGYVLKHQNLRSINNNIRFKDLVNPPPKIMKLKVDIVSGQLLPRPKELKAEENLNPFVQFELIESDLVGSLKITDMDSKLSSFSSTGSAMTRPVFLNGFNPVWNYRFECHFKSVNGLDFIRFLVKTGDITFAVNCSKLSNLTQGYRHIPLYDLKGEEYIFSTLFINIKYEELDD